MQPRGARVPCLRLQGQAGPRQHPQPRRRSLHAASSSKSPRSGEVYNLGGGKATPAAFSRPSSSSRRSPGRSRFTPTCRERGSATTSATTATCARCGSTIRRWDITIDLAEIVRQIVEAWQGQARLVRILITGACGFVGTTLLGPGRSRARPRASRLDNLSRPGSEMNRAGAAAPRREAHPRRPAGRERPRGPAGRRRGGRRRRQPECAGRCRRPHLEPAARRAQPPRHGEHARVLQRAARRLRPAQHQPRLLDPAARRAAGPRRRTGLRARPGSRACRRASRPHGLREDFSTAPPVSALRRHQARERAAGPRVRRDLRLPRLDQPLWCAGRGRAVRARRPGHLLASGSTAGWRGGRCATSASTARGTRCATACTPPISFRSSTGS